MAVGWWLGVEGWRWWWRVAWCGGKVREEVVEEGLRPVHIQRVCDGSDALDSVTTLAVLVDTTQPVTCRDSTQT